MEFHQGQHELTTTPVRPLRIGQLLRPVTPLRPLDTVGKALHQLREQQAPWLPVVDHGMLMGWVREAPLADAVLAAPDALDAATIASLIEPAPVALTPDLYAIDARPLFEEAATTLLPVITMDGRYVGCAGLAEVAAALAGRLAPPRIGGMATPLGVYLTSGVASGGAGMLGLVLSGMTLALLFWLCQMVVAVLAACVFYITRAPLAQGIYVLMIGRELYASSTVSLLLSLGTGGVLLLLFMIALRLAPKMAGYHAAEHQTVHALEQGEPLTPEAVARMPRVHPRCGTNLWGIISLGYLGMSLMALMFSTAYARAHQEAFVLPCLVIVLVVVLFWRTLGGWMQQYFTTRPATRDELESGIRAAQEVLRNHYALTEHPDLSFGRRVWHMGLVQAACGVTAMAFLLNWGTFWLDRLLFSLVK